MDKDFHIDCGCGYRIHYSEHERGTTQTCIHCSAEVILDVPEPELPSLAPEPEDQISGFQQTTTPKQAYSSPFEDDDEPDTGEYAPAVIPRVESQPAPEAEGHTVASLSFEDETETHTDESDTEKPDPGLLRSYEGAEHTNRYQKIDETATCPRCGNPFRGDWDKQSINGDEICYICSNQATEGMQEREETRKFISTDYLEEGPKEIARLHRDSPTVEGHAGGVEKFWLFNPESDEFRTMIYVLAFGTIFLTIFLVFTTDMSVPTQTTSEIAQPVQDVDAAPLPLWARVVIAGWKIFSRVFTFIGAAYLVLRLTDRMPHEQLGRDLILITIALSPFLIGEIVLAAIYVFFDSGFLSQTIGLAIAVFIRLISLLITILTLTNLLDFRIRDFVYMLFVDGFVTWTLSLLGVFVYAWVAYYAL